MWCLQNVTRSLTLFRFQLNVLKLKRQCRRNLQSESNVNNVPRASLVQIKKTLRIHGLVHEDGFTCLALAQCPVGCQDRRKEKKFFINKTTGLCVCHSCGRTTSWEWLERRLGDKNKTAHPLLSAVPPSDPVPEPSERCQPVATANKTSLKQCLEKLNLSHVSIDSLATMGACFDPEESRLLLPLRGPDNSVGSWKSLTPGKDEDVRPVEEVLGLRPSSMATTPFLLANEIAWSGLEVVMVPTAADLLALAAQNIPAICVASGARNLSLEALPSLEHFTKITLWFGSHTEAGRTFARKLGESRCFLVRPTEELSGAHEEMCKKESKARLSKIIKSAQPVAHPSITTFSALRCDVHSELSGVEIAKGVPWQRFPQLTSILGGFRRGELSVITGPTGSGKTTFMSEYSLDLCIQGVSTMWGSFEIKNTRLARTIMTQLAGTKLEDNMDKFDEIADQMEQLPLYFMAFHGQQPLKSVMETVMHAAYVYDIAHVIIDNVQFMLGLSESESHHIDRFYRQDVLIESFRRFATNYNCHVTLVIHPRKEASNELLTSASIFGGAKASQEADNVLILQDQVTNNSLKGKKYLQIVKNRYSGDLGFMPLDFDRDSYSFVKKKKAAPTTPTANNATLPPPKPALRMMPVPTFLQNKTKLNENENQISR